MLQHKSKPRKHHCSQREQLAESESEHRATVATPRSSKATKEHQQIDAQSAETVERWLRSSSSSNNVGVRVLLLRLLVIALVARVSRTPIRLGLAQTRPNVLLVLASLLHERQQPTVAVGAKKLLSSETDKRRCLRRVLIKEMYAVLHVRPVRCKKRRRTKIEKDYTSMRSACTSDLHRVRTMNVAYRKVNSLFALAL